MRTLLPSVIDMSMFRSGRDGSHGYCIFFVTVSFSVARFLLIGV